MKAPEGMTVPPPVAVDFWEARPELSKIRTYAHASIVSPWAVLGCVLASVAEAIPPTVVLPPLGNGVDATASLNIFFGLVGSSGAGKGAATRTAEGVLGVQGPSRDTMSVPLGTGEGIAQSFIKSDVDKDAPPHLQVRDTSVRFDIPEVDTYTSLLARQGAIVDQEVRRLWSGEVLGTANANKETRRIIPADMHRGTIIMGIQPIRAEGLLGTAGGGTLQRMIFLPADDPNMPLDTPTAPEPLHWSSPHRALPTSGKLPVKVAPRVKEEMRVNRIRRHRDGGDPEKTHRDLSKLKVAALLAALNGHRDVMLEDWELAELVMFESDIRLEEIKSAIRDVRARESKARGFAAAARSEAEESAKSKRLEGRILSLVADGQEHRWGDFRRTINSRDREDLDAALHRLESAGRVRVWGEPIAGKDDRIMVRLETGVDILRSQVGGQNVHPSTSPSSSGSQGWTPTSTHVHPPAKGGWTPVDTPVHPAEPLESADREGWTKCPPTPEQKVSTHPDEDGNYCRCGGRLIRTWGKPPTCETCQEEG